MTRILMAEPDEGVRRSLTTALEEDGHQVVAAHDGEHASLLLTREAFDLLVTALELPRLDGLTLLNRARGEQPELEVVVLAGVGGLDAALEAMKQGAFDFLQKPVESATALKLLVKRALEHRTLVAMKDRLVQTSSGAPQLTWGDPAMTPVVEALQKVARTDASVLLLGESGVGTEVAALAVHKWSGRASGPFTAINCASLSESLLESELFGHEKGAFTGAHAQRRGRIELTEGGTFFLDEVAELRPDLQAKLLRVLQEKTFQRVGGTRLLRADVRWVAATNRNLRAAMKSGAFREDLYHRLAVFPVSLPPLRSRRADILPLAHTLLRRISAELGHPPLELELDAAQLLVQDDWPGNVRALKNALERAAILADGGRVGPEHLVFERPASGIFPAPGHGQGSGISRLPSVNLPVPRPPPVKIRSLAELEKDAIREALAHVAGNRRKAAELLEIGERTLYEKIKRYGLE